MAHSMDFMPGSLIGQPVDRAEDPRFLAGTGQFIGDLQRDGMLHAAVFRSGVAHGCIRNIDTTAARRIAGVHAIITAADGQ
jgi:carbon-monoxide dehydrogenase large subunit